MLKKQYRLNKEKDISAVNRQGSVFYSPLFLLKCKENNQDHSRFSVVVSNKVSKSAVRRNILKRRIREVVRLIWPQLKPGFDFLIFASPKLIRNDQAASYKEVQESVSRLLQKAKIL
ncbi:MAG: ribonuclease P protein component [Candidatus Parcubacteria bacterium]|nr:ribonuclease P protein component [Candidatus Parcubacteria bacterium]